MTVVFVRFIESALPEFNSVHARAEIKTRHVVMQTAVSVDVAVLQTRALTF